MKAVYIILNSLLRSAVLLLCAFPLVPAQAQALAAAVQNKEPNFSVEAATQPGNFHTPLDATPDPLGNFIYFVAIGPNGAGVFRVSSAANSPVIALATGHPFVAPTGIAISTDGLSLYVADAQAWTDEGPSGQIFVLPVSGGTPQPLAGAAGTKPRNLDVVNENGRDVIYYSGREPRHHQPAIFRLNTNPNSAARILAQGEPLVEPDGIAVTRTGVVYVADRASAGAARGNIFRIKGRAITAMTTAVRLGNPAGIALTFDESTLLVSSLQRDGHDQVLLLDLRTLRTQTFTNVVGQNENDAGGLHRAHDRNAFSWCGVTVGDRGTVYAIKP